MELGEKKGQMPERKENELQKIVENEV